VLQSGTLLSRCPAESSLEKLTGHIKSTILGRLLDGEANWVLCEEKIRRICGVTSSPFTTYCNPQVPEKLKSILFYTFKKTSQPLAPSSTKSHLALASFRLVDIPHIRFIIALTFVCSTANGKTLHDPITSIGFHKLDCAFAWSRLMLLPCMSASDPFRIAFNWA
jgi:hypothetical protein